MNKRFVPLLAIFALLLLVSCTPGPNAAANLPAENGMVAGFLYGLWHGCIAPVTFIASLFIDNISVYEIHNNGAWYDFGFVLGAGILFGGGSKGAGRVGRSKNNS